LIGLSVAEPLIRWDWIIDHRDLIFSRLIQHIWLTVWAVVIGFAISFPVAILTYRRRWLYSLVTGFAGWLYTIPSLALFILLLPITHVSNVTVEIGLVSYTLLILIRNIVVGLEGVPEDVKEAARGMGYTKRQLLWRVELPLALPAIIAGVRIATVSTIGLITVAALIGKGALGQFLLEGLQIFFETKILLGAVLSIALALVADGALLGLQRALTPWTRPGMRAKAFVPWRKAGLPVG
jgi:osmoprotectant transport system permease protein